MKIPLIINGNYNKTLNGTDRDFLLNNVDVGERFIKRALEKGYQGVLDPVDAMAIGYSTSAKIIFDYSDIEITKEKKYTDLF